MCGSCNESRNVLILRNGGENQCSTLVKNYIGRHTNFEEKLIDNESFQERKQDCCNKTLVVLLCQVQDRLELFQDRMVSELSGYLKKNLVVIYVASRDLPNPYYVTNSSKLTTQINVSLENLDKRFIENTLKRSLNITSDNEGPKNKFAWLFFGIILGVLCLRFMKPKDVPSQFNILELQGRIENMRAEINDLKLQQTAFQKNVTIQAEEIQVFRVENEVYKKKIEEYELLIESQKSSQWDYKPFLLSIFLLEIMRIRLLPLANIFFGKVKSLFKKAKEQGDTETLSENCVVSYSTKIESEAKNFMKSDSSDIPAHSQNEDDSTESSVQTVELEEAEKLMAYGSGEKTIPASIGENLAPAETFSDERDEFVLLSEGQNIREMEENVSDGRNSI